MRAQDVIDEGWRRTEGAKGSVETRRGWQVRWMAVGRDDTSSIHTEKLSSAAFSGGLGQGLVCTYGAVGRMNLYLYTCCTMPQR